MPGDGGERVFALVKQVSSVLNGAENPALAITALQYIVASTIASIAQQINLPNAHFASLFFDRVLKSVEDIENGVLVLKEPG